jgi:hypothetical protein
MKGLVLFLVAFGFFWGGVLAVLRIESRASHILGNTPSPFNSFIYYFGGIGVELRAPLSHSPSACPFVFINSHTFA